MTRPDLLRPIIIPTHPKELHESVLRSCMRTLGIDRDELKRLLDEL